MVYFIDIEGRSQSWPPFFPGMESNLGGIRFYSESACVNCIFLRYERIFNRARKAATSATHIKVIARVICIAHSPHLFSAKSRIPPNCSPCRGKKFTWAVLKLWDLCLYICGVLTSFATNWWISPHITCNAHLTLIRALYERNSVTRERVTPGSGDDRDIK